MVGPSWKDRFDAEVSRAESARASGNEGQARVCARRAAGAAIREYLDRQADPLAGNAERAGAYDLLRALQERASLSPTCREIIGHLLQRVEPGGVYPANIDLIAEVRRLAEELGLLAENSGLDNETRSS